MSQITAWVPDELVEALDAVAEGLKRSRADIIRHALESFWRTMTISMWPFSACKIQPTRYSVGIRSDTSCSARIECRATRERAMAQEP